MNESKFDPHERERELRAESSAWDTSEVAASSPGDIPTVDVGPYFATGHPDDLGRAAAQLREASEAVGFHQLVGHGIDRTVTSSILDATRSFHALPLATKESILMDRVGWPLGGVGYLGMNNTKLPSRDTGNQNEAFLVKVDHAIDLDDNQWLSDTALPGFRSAVERYAGAIADLALRLLPVYAVALDLDEGFFADAFVNPFWRLRMTHYPPAIPNTTTYGIAPHVDTTFFTLLLQDGPGLTIFSHARQEWIAAPVVPGAFVVNTGELLKQWSNDRFLSTRHFATNTTTNDRYSVPFFFNANADHSMACLPTCHDQSNPPKYPTVSYRESQAAAQGE